MKTEIDFRSICADNLSLSLTCRTCLSTDPAQQMTPIFEQEKVSGKISVDFYEVLLLLKLKIAKDDGFPAKMCSICLSRLAAVDAFRKQCEKVQDYLVQHFVKFKDVKEEPKVGGYSSDSDQSNLDPSWEPLVEVKYENGESVSDNCDSDDEKLINFVRKNKSSTVAIRKDHTPFRSGSKVDSNNQTSEEFICNKCDEKFENINKYKYHLKSHISGKKYECRFCEESFIQLRYRKKHEKIHENDPNKPTFLCNICGKAYLSKNTLKIHIKLHNGKQYACDLCPKKFALKSGLKLHITKHNNEMPFQCEHCGRKFNQKSNLRQHLLLHNAKKSHKCEFCDEAYLRLRDLRRHRLLIHGQTDLTVRSTEGGDQSSEQAPVKQEETKQDQKKSIDLPYGCELCTRSFKLPSSLASHLKVHSEDRKFVCKECGNSFKKLDILRNHVDMVHLKKKAYSCEVCNKSFARVGDRNIHMRSHSEEKPHQCSYCGRGFHLAKALRAHTRQHTGERPFVCIICNAGFTCHKTLTSHTRRQHAEDQQILTKVDAITQAVLSAPPPPPPPSLPDANDSSPSIVSKMDTQI